MIHFLSDLHLSPQLNGVTELFLDYLAGPARQAEGIYILGDLFEAWIGDDDDDPYHQSIIRAFKAASDAGATIFILRGNRDFLLGDRFAEASGTTLLSDPYFLELPGKSFVLSHGDALCTDDLEYQAFRQQVRHLQWQAGFLAKPLDERRALANHLRQQSEENKKYKNSAQMDLNPVATAELIRENHYATLIHGHTHQPATHRHEIDAHSVERWVLADWREDCGEIVVWNGAMLHRQPLRAANADRLSR